MVEKRMVSLWLACGQTVTHHYRGTARNVPFLVVLIKCTFASNSVGCEWLPLCVGLLHLLWLSWLNLLTIVKGDCPSRMGAATMQWDHIP